MPIYQLFTLNFLLTIYQQGCLNFYTIPPKISYKKNSSPPNNTPIVQKSPAKIAELTSIHICIYIQFVISLRSQVLNLKSRVRAQLPHNLELRPAVSRPTLLRAIIGYGLALAITVITQPCAVDAVLDDIVIYCLGTVLRKPVIILVTALVIRVAANLNIHLVVL